MNVQQKNWTDIIKPNGLATEYGSDPDRRATIVVQPLERGFGLTLGNALRRVLLSSLQGAAVTSIQIEGVLHEFSSIPGVLEDVTDIVLNVKALAMRIHGTTARRLSLRAKGSGAVTASQIEGVHDVEILNPDHVLMHLDQDVEVVMEMIVESGKGYVPAVQNRAEDSPIGLIPVDAIFSPVKKVSYKVENARVGQVTDLDKLSLTVETNGAVTPEDSVALAARILQDQLQLFINFEEPKQIVREEQGRQSAVQPEPAAQGRRTGTVGPFRELPEERQHHLYRRPGAKDRNRNAAYAELRPQIPERDQGSAVTDGPGSGHGNPGLAAGKHRRPGPQAGRALLGPAEAQVGRNNRRRPVSGACEKKMAA